MAATSAQAQKSSSRWGSFLAGVESRLDTILTEEDPKTSQNKVNGHVADPPSKVESMTVAILPAARAASSTRAQDRLNEKMARAMANKNLGKKHDTSAPSSGVPSRIGTPVSALESPKRSAELSRNTETMLLDTPPTSSQEQGQANDEPTLQLPDRNTLEEKAIHNTTAFITNRATSVEELAVPRISTESRGSGSTRPSMELTRSTTPNIAASPKVDGTNEQQTIILMGEHEKTVQELRKENESAELRRQEEIHQHMERIDALQAKLQYLTKEATEAARSAASESKVGSPEQKLAAKDEKIALLIEEGQKLSQIELKHMTVIKKLRTKCTEEEKSVAEARKACEKVENKSREAQDRAKRAEIAEKRANEKLRSFSKLEKEVEAARVDKDMKDSLIRDLQTQLSVATSAAKEAEGKAQAEALEVERSRAAELAEELSALKISRDADENEHRTLLRELQEKSEREKERVSAAELARQGEQNMMESRLEAYRARAEEASAGSGGDVQAKLLRQVETLQNQYAVASENWQGIEASLQSRVTILEQEQANAAKREAELRRKARELNSKARRLEEDLEKTTARSQELDYERSSCGTQLATLQARLDKAEAQLTTVRTEFEAERDTWESKQMQRIEEERMRCKEELKRFPSDQWPGQFRSEQPLVMQPRTRKSSIVAADRSSGHSRYLSGNHSLSINTHTPSPAERSSRQSSIHRIPPNQFDSFPRMIERQDSVSTIPNISVNHSIPETPSVDYDTRNGGDDDFFGNMRSPNTPPERTINDLVSVSTAAAGPSVQLVERMSAAVRRLESEKAAHKDELVRLGQQRDEARDQVVELMRDNEGKKAVDARVNLLEADLEDLKGRYDTTLEMLGEKSERVEELKQDVLDLKGMMREMVEERVK